MTEQPVQVKIGEPLDEISNALMSILNVVRVMAHTEDDIGAIKCAGNRGLLFTRSVDFVANQLAGRPNTTLALALLKLAVQEPDQPKKLGPALKIVR